MKRHSFSCCQHVDFCRNKGIISFKKSKSSIRELYSEPNLHIDSVSRLDNIKQRFDAGAQYAELLIANYDMAERQRLLPQQLCFTDFSNERIH